MIPSELVIAVLQQRAEARAREDTPHGKERERTVCQGCKTKTLEPVTSGQDAGAVKCSTCNVIDARYLTDGEFIELLRGKLAAAEVRIVELEAQLKKAGD